MTKKREYKPSEQWDDVVPTTQFQFEQLCNFMAFGGYPIYNKNFTFVSKSVDIDHRYVSLDRAIALFNNLHLRLKVIEKVRLEKRKDGKGGYYLHSFDKVKFYPESCQLAEIVLKTK